MRGYVQVYTGDGKGKTTAALGLIVRAVGAGLRVYFGQFVKGRTSSEIRTLRSRFPEVTVRQFGRAAFIRGKPSARDIAAAKKGFQELRRAVHGGRYDLVIADEANVALSLGLLDRDELLSLAEDKPENVELLITGRGASPALIRRADLVTHMRAVKHYYDAGVKGRPGIES